MKRLVAPLGALLAVALLVLLGFLLLGGEPAPAPPPRPAPPPDRPEPRPAPSPDPEPEPAPDPAPPPAQDPEDPPLSPDAYPWAVPPWWHEHDRVLRETEVDISGEQLSVQEILDHLAKATKLIVRPGREIEGWAGSTRIASPMMRGPARAILEALATRYNLEPYLTREGVALHQRGRVPPTRLAQAGRVQWALSEARDRREGKRPAEAASDLARAMAVQLSFSRVPLRQAAETIHDRAGVPVYLDATLWSVNPRVTLEPGKATLGEALDAMLEPLGAASDANPRRIVIFRP